MRKVPSSIQIDLADLFQEQYQVGDHCLRVPTESFNYVQGKSSKGKKVQIPSWVSLDGWRYTLLENFPNASGDVLFHPGAHGCVAAYVASEFVQGLPLKFALKCVNYGQQNKKGSPWVCEWRIHQFLKSHVSSDSDSFVQCYAAVKAQVQKVSQVYFALELMDTDLFTIIETSQTVPNFGRWILNCLYKTSRSLLELHRAGIIYCDLKPENVLVSMDSEGPIKFGDFDRSSIPVLNVGVVGGTKGYYSPERLLDPSVHTLADDAWALGVLILIAATKAASPYLGCTKESIAKFSPSNYLKRHQQCNWSDDVVERIGFLCDRLLQIDPSQRLTLPYVVDELWGTLSQMTEVPVLFYQDDDSFILPSEASDGSSAVTMIASPRHSKYSFKREYSGDDYPTSKAARTKCDLNSTWYSLLTF